MLKICKYFTRNEVSFILKQNRFLINKIASTNLSTDTSENSTNFGFKRVKYEEKQGKVNEVFNNVAEKYDIMNDAMSFGLHRLWKNKFIEEIEPSSDMKLIDMAGGTGRLQKHSVLNLE